MKQRFLVCVTLAVLLVLGLCSVTFAAEDPIKVTMDLSSNRFSGPGEVTVIINVTNISDTDMPGPVALYYPDGNMISDFGTPTLTAGASKTWSGTWNVTREQLTQGRLTFAVGYPIRTADGMMLDKKINFYSTIVDAGAVANVEITRRITPSMAKKGQEVSVVYEIANVGTIDVTNVVIKESSAVAKEEGKIALVRAGEKATHVFTVKMGTKDLASSASISYMANGKSYHDEVEKATIKYGNVKLDATLTADKRGGNPGDTVKLTLTVKNTGKSDYQNITVTDAILGTVFSGLKVEAGKTLTQEKEITITSSMEYQFTVSGTDASGSTVETATGRVPVTAVDATKAVTLEVRATADSETIYTRPGIVTFTVDVSNLSAVEAKNVTVSATNVTLYTFDSIQPGQTRRFVRDVRVETPGKFRFDATVKDQLGESVTFQSNIVQIVYSLPTPTPSQVPIATPALPNYESAPESDGLPPYVDMAQEVLRIARWVFLGLGVLCLGLVAVGSVSRAAQAKKSSQAPDHLELDGYRDYTQAVTDKERRMMPEEDPALDHAPQNAGTRSFRDLPRTDDAEQADTPTDEETASAEDGARMEATMADLYPEVPTEPADQAPAEPAAPTYRRRRREDDAE